MRCYNYVLQKHNYNYSGENEFISIPILIYIVDELQLIIVDLHI